MSVGTSILGSRLKAIFLLSAGGWLCAFYLLFHEIRLSTRGLEAPSICNINSYFDCDAVALSKYSQIFGIPVALFLITFYAVIFFLSLWTYFASVDNDKVKVERGLALGFVLSSVFLVGSLYMSFISFFILEKACLFCLASYAINILLFIFYLQLHKKYRTHKGNIVEYLLLPPNFGIFLLAIMSLHAFMPKIIENSLFNNTPPDYEQIVNLHLSETQTYQFNEDAYPSVGAPKEKAKMTIVEYSDFQCPHCAKLASDLDPFIKGNKDRVRFVFKYFPLNMCDSTRKNHPMSCLASKIMQCVFKKFGSEVALKLAHKDFYPKQRELTESYMKEAAIKYGYDRSELDSCVSDPITHNEIMASIQEAQAAKVDATPSVFVNGRRLNYPIPKVLSIILGRL